MSGDEFTGTWRLVRFAVRRDRIRLALWVVGLSAVLVLSGWSLRGVYGDTAAVRAYVDLIEANPALRAFAGPGYGFDDPSIGIVLVMETQLWGMVAIAVMSAFVLVRLTRAEEEDGTAELLLSTTVGRHAPLAAGVFVVAVAQLVVGVSTFAGFVAVGYETSGSAALVVSIVALGWLFTGIASVVAQVAAGARAAIGATVLVLVVAFVIRAVGDAGDTAVRWVSPLGVAQSIEAFTADEAWWTAWVVALAAVVTVAVAAMLAERRDVGAGLVVHRPGRAHARGWASTPAGLSRHLQRNVLGAWVLGLALMGVFYGMIGDEVDALVEDNPVLAELIARLEGTDVTEAYLATAVTMLALASSGWVVSSVLQVRSAEVSGRAELVLAGPTSRTRWFVAHVAVALAGGAAVLAAAGVGVAGGYAWAADDAGQLAALGWTGLVAWPALVVVAGLTALVVAWLPHRAVLAWGVVVFVAVVGLLADLLELPQVLRMLSPFEHVADVPAESPTVWAALALTAVGVVMLFVAATRFRRRDLAT